MFNEWGLRSETQTNPHFEYGFYYCKYGTECNTNAIQALSAKCGAFAAFGPLSALCQTFSSSYSFPLLYNICEKTFFAGVWGLIFFVPLFFILI